MQMETKKEVEMNKDGKESESSAIDTFLNKAISRKLLVFLIATGLVFASKLESETWALIAMCYIGGQSIIDLVKVWKN